MDLPSYSKCCYTQKKQCIPGRECAVRKVGVLTGNSITSIVFMINSNTKKGEGCEELHVLQQVLELTLELNIINF